MNCKTCCRALRPPKTPVANHPGTVVEWGQGYCRKCYMVARPEKERTERPADCVICARPMRPGTAKSADYPGMVRHKAYGKCWGCYKREKVTPSVRDEELVIQSDAPGDTVSSLEWFLARRQERMAEQARRDALRAKVDAGRERFLAARRLAA